MTPELNDAFTWYCRFMDAQGADHPDTFADLSRRRQHILETMADAAQAHKPAPERPRTTTGAMPLRERIMARRMEEAG